MNDCLVEIATIHEEKRSVLRVKGAFERREDGFVAIYPQDGDETTLVLAGDTLTMTRRGETELSAKFHVGEDTSLVLRFGEHEGSIPIQTFDCFHHLEGNNKTCVTLKYALVYPDHLQRFSLEIVISEEK